MRITASYPHLCAHLGSNQGPKVNEFFGVFAAVLQQIKSLCFLPNGLTLVLFGLD